MHNEDIDKDFKTRSMTFINRKHSHQGIPEEVDEGGLEDEDASPEFKFGKKSASPFFKGNISE